MRCQPPEGCRMARLERRPRIFRVALVDAGANLVMIPHPMEKPQWRNGRRGRLKICCLQGRAGSSPAWGTIGFLDNCFIRRRTQLNPR